MMIAVEKFYKGEVYKKGSEHYKTE